MEDSCEPDWSRVIGDESPPRAANERTTGVNSGTPDCTADSMFVETPYEGQVFDTVDEASSFYEKYGRTKGFSTKKRNSKKRPRSEEITRATFCCLSNGLLKKNQTSSTSEQDGKKRSSYQCGCKATSQQLLR
ncbi:hypothetical protein GIB67_004814 [Kingdonia uniflora]|uniref:FAR1 domain-containing protein n=1 Tax=Kingdonia uniflora TaxID=39325 RepID=A0A7J7LN96_9MAGN|nr:hypothetical protein GIB67_004814 [Kingdonia uniflora]